MTATIAPPKACPPWCSDDSGHWAFEEPNPGEYHHHRHLVGEFVRVEAFESNGALGGADIALVPGSWVELSPEQAEQLAAELVEAAAFVRCVI